MNVTYICPYCKQAVREIFTSESEQLVCSHCSKPIDIPSTAVEEGRIHRCLVCPSTDLYVRKDFPQWLGVSIVVLGFIASSIAWANYHIFWTFAILFLTALVDVGLYAIVGNALLCYRCGALYRGAEDIDVHGAFNLETHERYRQLNARIEDRGTSDEAKKMENAL